MLLAFSAPFRHLVHTSLGQGLFIRHYHFDVDIFIASRYLIFGIDDFCRLFISLLYFASLQLIILRHISILFILGAIHVTINIARYSFQPAMP
jgi:hypothetical protein